MGFTHILLFLLLSEAKSQEVTTPSSLLGPRNFNHHSFDADQILKNLNLAETSPTKQGPVLFPNDAPPPPPTPLIVTSRPLSESIARSELNPNNSVAAQSRINGAFVPAYLGRVKSYKPFGRGEISYETSTIPYDTVQYDYESRSPPIYQAISEHAQKNVQKVKKIPKQYNYQAKQPVISQHNNVQDDENNSDYSNHGENYAFSYTVKDQERGDDFSHSQQSSRSATNGEYRVRLPDGRMQIVSYTADENGYKADVRYDEDEKSANTIDNNFNKNAIYRTNYKSNAVNQNIYNDNIGNQKSFNHNAGSQNTYNNNNEDSNTNYKIYNANINPTLYVDNYKLNKNVKDNEYIDAKDKQYNVNEKDYYTDTSKEYYNEDYSSEYNVKYEPHVSKYKSFQPSTVKPSYEELKNLFTKEAFNTQQNYNKNKISNIPYTQTTQSPQELTARNVGVEKNLFSVPSTYSSGEYSEDFSATPIYVPDFNQHTSNIAYSTSNPLDYTTERTVVIGGKKPLLFTDIKSSIPSLTQGSFVPSTPGSYLVSTISSLKNNFSPSVLSNKFIDRIQKYINFK